MPRSIELTELERRKLADAGRQSIACTNGWRPIETAPKDGHILVYGIWRNELGQEDTGPSIHVVTYECGLWEVTGGCFYQSCVDATHWQPLPKPPQEDLK